MSRALSVALLAVLAAACSKSQDKASAPVGPPAVASCDYHSKTVGENHSCYEIYDSKRVSVYETFCNSLRGARDHGEFARGKGCATDGRKSGCLESDGAVVWVYEGEQSCFGQEFKGSTAPAYGAAQPYHCSSPNVCQESWSVFDLTPTVTKRNCETASGGTFAAGACPTDKVIGRCDSDDTSMVVRTIFYAPLTVEQVRPNCESNGGTFTVATAGSGS